MAFGHRADICKVPPIHSLIEAIQCLEDVRCFLQSRGCTSEAISTGAMIDNFVSRAPSATQIIIHHVSSIIIIITMTIAGS